MVSGGMDAGGGHLLWEAAPAAEWWNDRRVRWGFGIECLL